MPEPTVPEQAETISTSTYSRHELRERQKHSRRIYLDPSSPQIRSIGRVVVITLVLLFIAGWLQTIITSLANLFFLVVLSIFFAYLMDPLVKLIRRPFKARGKERWMPRSIAIPIAYLIDFTIVGVAISI